MVGGLFYTLPFIPGLTLWFVLILHSSHKILCDSSIMIEKASNYTMNALKKSSGLWHSSSGRKARPRIVTFLYKNSSDHEFRWFLTLKVRFWHFFTNCCSLYSQSIRIFFKYICQSLSKSLLIMTHYQKDSISELTLLCICQIQDLSSQGSRILHK